MSQKFLATKKKEEEKKQNKRKFPDEEMGGGKVTSSRRSHHPAASADWSARAGWQVVVGVRRTVAAWTSAPIGGDFWPKREREREKIKKREKALGKKMKMKVSERGEYGKEEEPEEGVSVGRKQELSQLGIRPAVLSLSDAKFPFKLPRQVVPDR